VDVDMLEPAEGGGDRSSRRLYERGARDATPSKEGGEQRLTGLYPKPLEGEKVPISFLGSEKIRVGWSPEDGKSVQIDEETDLDSLKRVREINEVQIFNWLTGREGLIELPDREMEELSTLLEAKNGEQLVYSREKVKGKLKPRFDLEEVKEPRRWLLSERL
jgi:hypothetical protein